MQNVIIKKRHPPKTPIQDSLGTKVPDLVKRKAQQFAPFMQRKEKKIESNKRFENVPACLNAVVAKR